MAIPMNLQRTQPNHSYTLYMTFVAELDQLLPSIVQNQANPKLVPKEVKRKSCIITFNTTYNTDCCIKCTTTYTY